VHFEVKRAEKLSIYPAMAQARKDAGEAIPVVAHRRNLEEWVAVVPLDDLPKLAVTLFHVLADN
jgi:hypothetical protein